jgi:hypothetical protein
VLTHNVKYSVLFVILILQYVQLGFAGPPFDTDDPEPVKHRHWEFYLSSVSAFQPGEWSGTCPHFEINYGLAPNVQIHLLLPVNYNYTPHQEVDFGFGYTEIGVKYRFVQETKDSPQIGIFPIIEIPIAKNTQFSNGKVQIYLPVWVQKSWGKLTTYGGAGYWINPGTNNKNWIFTGWEAQYDISPVITLGGELYYHSADASENKSVTAFNIGGSVNASQKVHFIFSAGHCITGDNFTSAYAGLLLSI